MEPMNILANTNQGNTQIQRDLFDFDIGYFIKSPCRVCPKSKDMPLCHKDCEIIDRIQTILARGISSQSSRDL